MKFWFNDIAWTFSKWILDLIVLENLENFDVKMNLEFEIELSEKDLFLLKIEIVLQKLKLDGIAKSH